MGFKRKKLEKQNKSWEKEWVGMPEYNNINKVPPEIEVTFKFRSKEDFDFFHKIIKEKLYEGKKVFDGMQRANKKSAWYPLNEKASKYVYE